MIDFKIFYFTGNRLSLKGFDEDKYAKIGVCEELDEDVFDAWVDDDLLDRGEPLRNSLKRFVFLFVELLTVDKRLELSRDADVLVNSFT